MTMRWSLGGWSVDAERRSCPKAGELVAWEFVVWRVVDVQERDDAARPLILRLRRERGPVHPWEREDADQIVHVVRGAAARTFLFQVVAEPYPVCSCHGDPWPCKQLCTDRQVAAAARALEVRLARAVPGVCAAGGEPVTVRQRHVVFPGDNLLVPGGPPATFHLRRAKGCRWRAEEYEQRRLKADPTVQRLCTCPGIRFEHRDLGTGMRGPIDCSAGPACTGHHDGRGNWCGTAITTATGERPRPFYRCDQPRCQGLATDWGPAAASPPVGT